jgi:hypothetical protein
LTLTLRTGLILTVAALALTLRTGLVLTVAALTLTLRTGLIFPAGLRCIRGSRRLNRFAFFRSSRRDNRFTGRDWGFFSLYRRLVSFFFAPLVNGDMNFFLQLDLFRLLSRLIH